MLNTVLTPPNRHAIFGEMGNSNYLDEENPDFHMRRTAPAIFKAEVENSIHKLEELEHKSLLARGASKSVFGRTGVCEVLKAVALTDLMRAGLGTDHKTLGDWLASETKGDADSAIDVVRLCIKAKMRESMRFDNQVNAMQHLEDALHWVVAVLRRPEPDAIRPYCILCWRHPRVAGDRKYCLEHSPEREIREKRPSDYSGYVRGRRQMIRIARALCISDSKNDKQKLDSLFCAEVFGALKRRHDGEFTEWQRRSDAIDDVMTNADLFQDEHWTFVAGRVADFAQCYKHAHKALGDILPNVETESRDQWLERILGQERLDNLDAFDDVVKYPNHLLGLIARYNLYQMGCDLVASSGTQRPTQSKRARALALRAKKLSYTEIGKRLGITRQRAHALCVGKRKKPKSHTPKRGKRSAPGNDRTK